MNVKRLLISIVLVLILATCLSSFIQKDLDSSFINTIYTIAGIMFSIGMGILCTLNPEKVINETYYKAIRNNVIDVRNTYLLYFFILSIAYLAYQLDPLFSFKLGTVGNISIIFKTSFAAILINILGVLYFIANFMDIQQLGFDISDRTRE